MHSGCTLDALGCTLDALWMHSDALWMHSGCTLDALYDIILFKVTILIFLKYDFIISFMFF